MVVGGVVNRLRKIALTLERGRYSCKSARLRIALQRFVAEKEEGAIAAVIYLRKHHRPAYVYAAAPVPHNSFFVERVRIRGCIEHVVLRKREQGPVQLIIARFCRHGDDAAANAPVLSAVIVHFDVNFRDRVRTERKRDAAEEQAVVADAIGLVVRGAHASSADRHSSARRDISGSDGRLLAARISEHAWDQVQHL